MQWGISVKRRDKKRVHSHTSTGRPFLHSHINVNGTNIHTMLWTADEKKWIKWKTKHTHTRRIVFSSMPLPFMVSQHSHTHAIDLTWKENHFQVWAYNMRSWSCTTKWVNVIEVRSMQYMRSTYTPPPPPPHCHLIHTHERYTLDTSHEVMEQFQSSHKLRKPVQGVHAELKKKNK